MTKLRDIAILLAFTAVCLPSLIAQQVPTSGDVTVKLMEPINFATARPLQAVRSTVFSSTNPAIPSGSAAVLQLQNRDGSYTLKLIRIMAAGAMLKTMSAPGTSVDGTPASGPHPSLAAGSTLKLTLTQQDGTPGMSIQHAMAPAATRPVPAARATAPQSKSSDPATYVIEGTGLGMTRQQVEAAAKAHGGTHGLHDTGNGYPEIDTSDLHFVSVQFNDRGLVDSYNVVGLPRKNVKSGNFSGPLYDMAVAAFGQPASDGQNSKWNFDKPGQPNAEYTYDKGEVPNGELIVGDGK